VPRLDQASSCARFGWRGLVYTSLKKFVVVFGAAGTETVQMKKFFGIFALAGAAFAALTFWKNRQTDDEFLDEELD
jgi:hypothetical protein